MSPIGVFMCVGFFVAVGAGVLLAQWFDARSSGWASLGRRYAGPKCQVGRRFPSATVRINHRWYVELVNLTVSSHGIGLIVSLPLRPFYRAVLVPWDDVEFVSLSDAGALTVRLGDSAKATVAGSAAVALLGALGVPATREESPTDW